MRGIQWFLQQCENNLSFIFSVLFTDKAVFSRDGIMNFHVSHVGREKFSGCSSVETLSTAKINVGKFW
jgi:hypothetical protein